MTGRLPQLYERLVLSKNKAALLNQAATAEASETMTPEEGLIQHLADFLLELGDDFAYVGRQRRLRIDDAWFRVDLLFFNRRLKGTVRLMGRRR